MTAALLQEPLRKPSVLLTLPWALHHIGGVNEVVKNTLRRLKDGNDFRPLLMVGSEPDGHVGEEHLGTIYFPLYGPFDSRRPFRAAISFVAHLPFRLWRLWRLLQRNRVEIINAHYPHLGCLYFVLLRALGLYRGSLILSFHLGDVQGAERTRGMERIFWSILLRSADHIVTPSNTLWREVLAVEPRVATKLMTIHNGVDFALFSVDHAQNGAPLAVSAHRVIITVGNFEERKGHHTLMEAFAGVRHRLPGTVLVHVGRVFPFMDQIKKMRDSLQLREVVQFVENVPHDQIPLYLSKASLFVCASRAEGFPLVILEAGAAGLPVVTTRASGVDEIITDGVTGRLVDVDDVKALGEAMVDVLSHPQDAVRLACNLQERVRINFTWDHHFKQYNDLFRTELNRIVPQRQMPRQREGAAKEVSPGPARLDS